MRKKIIAWICRLFYVCPREEYERKRRLLKKQEGGKLPGKQKTTKRRKKVGNRR